MNFFKICGSTISKAVMTRFISRMFVLSLLLALAGGCAGDTSEDKVDENRPAPGSPKAKFEARAKGPGRGGAPGSPGGPTD